MVTKDIRPGNISIDKFNELLSQYPDLIDTLSSAKGVKPGQKTLSELDDFRYNDAVGLFSGPEPKRSMNHDDVKVLVDWKLRHGKFRPTLMKLVSSNDEDVVQETIKSAMEGYWESYDASVALNGITQLKGIGPATASLLLSIHDPDRVIFFSDEAFYWLCCDGKKSPIKYNPKEYQELNAAAQKLVKRLGVSATDVEKVAYVVMKQQDSVVMTPTPSSKEPAPSKKEEAKKPPPTTNTVKRKEKVQEEGATQSLRRSKRVKPS